jgi:hypothetical protein
VKQKEFECEEFECEEKKKDKALERQKQKTMLEMLLAMNKKSWRSEQGRT